MNAFNTASSSTASLSAAAQETTKSLLEALAKVRGTARLRLHLLSMDAKSRLHQLETRIEMLQSHVGAEADHVVAAGIREATDAVLALLREQPGPSLSTKVSEVMRSVQACAPSDNLSRAAQLMWELDCGFVPVCDRGGNLVGVVTDRDVCMAAYTRGQILSDIPVWSTMSTRIVTVAPSASLAEVLQTMREAQVRRVPVVDGERLVGAITVADVALYLDVHEASSLGAVELGSTLAAISTPRPGRKVGPA
jgi:CBS domain-containing protein